MSRYRNRRYRRNRVVDINMAPLIDMIFILLIFFLVTARFVKDTGVDIQRPTMATARSVTGVQLVVAVDAQGQFFFDGRPIDPERIRGAAERYRQSHPDAQALIVADTRSASGDLLQILDACRLAGLQQIRVAATVPEGSP